MTTFQIEYVISDNPRIVKLATSGSRLDLILKARDENAKSWQIRNLDIAQQPIIAEGKGE